VSSFFRRSTQISHARRAGKPSLLNDWAMASGDDMGDSGESKGVVLWRLDRLSGLGAIRRRNLSVENVGLRL
jgi:hypothetical protein